MYQLRLLKRRFHQQVQSSSRVHLWMIDPILSFSDRRVVGLDVRAGWIQFTSRFVE